MKYTIDVFNENEDLLDCISTVLIPRKGDIISIVDRTRSQNPDNRNPGGTDIIKCTEVKSVEIAYCKYGEDKNTDYVVPMVAVFV